MLPANNPLSTLTEDVPDVKLMAPPWPSAPTTELFTNGTCAHTNDACNNVNTCSERRCRNLCVGLPTRG